jgi:hypothetical protein
MCVHAGGQPDRPFLHVFPSLLCNGPAGKGPLLLWRPGEEKKCAKNGVTAQRPSAEAIFTPAQARCHGLIHFDGAKG